MHYTYLLLFQYKLYLQYTTVRVWYTMPKKTEINIVLQTCLILQNKINILL